jgi:hypothetical protein
MKSAMAFLVSIGLLGVAFGGGRTVLMVHARAPVAAMR